ncbi:3-deoxy-D-manno-octulosonic acid kinase [Marinobacter nanhaiticus D15-8W]|uniref:3-deoxy-D-manno-octulosonic acid kinase n=1 Tax=Marinobacter nanhaiticus D15-8W TaxID=626887 RepID=N6WUM1_9GAMM|nr:3-deoxy-D-manno-octulosonic acid kinase [Marinobacter nanhaiticus]ENO12568.1 3-deoxy-D-manno-octulosonic acid kinase [Marinobacter nanhaiticus D15-8W]BES69905.1 3-deoxy-D-manno-octulosonic acid kinase [Marinobacter nanhaiticus D15-8W]
MTSSFTRVEDKGEVALIAAGFEDVISPASFDPDHWREQAQPVAAGGRGSAWYIRRTEGDWVLRHYRRGGLAAKVSRDRFRFSGEARVRSFAELRLLDYLKRQALPVPAPVAAWYASAGPGLYRARILIERIVDAQTLLERAHAASDDLLSEAGRVIGRFHGAGLDHVDLNINNILLAPSGVYLVDFDKCAVREAGRKGLNWQQNNLARLRRSVDKELSQWPVSTREDFWGSIKRGYEAQMSALG